MKIPRDLTGAKLASGLKRIGYEFDRQVGSHMVLKCTIPRAHSITVPNHRPIKIGTLASILHEVALQHQMSIDQLLSRMKL
jgi:predicted RNA binding protein YcfA (HicA-like mRNA interferase family)